MPVLLLGHVANSLLSSAKSIHERETQEELQRQRAAENYAKYLGPGCYDVDRDFDHVQKVSIGNPMTSKVFFAATVGPEV